MITKNYVKINNLKWIWNGTDTKKNQIHITKYSTEGLDETLSKSLILIDLKAK